MSVICYAGLPGGGKSYSLIENVIIPALKEKRHVVHNLMLVEVALGVVVGWNVEPYLHKLPEDATAADVVRLSRPGAVICLDEVWQYWPAGTKANEVPAEELEFFKKHRHRVDEETGHASEIVIIDQDPKTGIPAFLRSLVELTYCHTKMDKVGAKGKFRVDVYSRCQSAEKPSKSALIRKLHGSYKPEVWNCYVSHTQSKKLGEAGLEKAPDDRGSVWKSWTVRAAMVAAVALPVLFYFAGHQLNKLGNGGGHVAPRASTASDQATGTAAPPQRTITTTDADGRVTVTTTSAAPPAAPSSAPMQRESERWRLAGLMTVGARRVAVLAGVSARNVAIEHCSQDDAGTWTCKVDGELIAAWTGPKSNSFTDWAAERVVTTTPPKP